MAQPIIRGIQAVGGVSIAYRYNGNGGKLKIPNEFTIGTLTEIDTSAGIQIAGFRLDSEFLRANPQIASSFVVPILGGGGVALTNNNRTGTLSINCTRVSTPDGINGSMKQSTDGTIGPVTADTDVFDMTLIAQIQQAQTGGDSTGATIAIKFDFCGESTIVQFEGCTIASVDPLGLSGNDLVSYNVSINYLNWKAEFGDKTGKDFINVPATTTEEDSGEGEGA